MGGVRIRLPVWWAAAFALCALWGRFVLLEKVVPQPDNDTQCYAEGAQAIRLGENPYTFGEGCYLYHPALATALSFLPEVEPRIRAQGAFVVLALAAGLLCAAVAGGAGLIGSPFGLLPFALLFTPTVQGAVGTGNVALVLSLSLAAALLVLRRAPSAAGVLLAVATLLKSVPGIFLLYLAVSAIRRRDRGDATAAVTGLALVTAAMLLPWTREFFEVSSRMVDLHADEVRNFAWIAWIHQVFEVPTPSPWPVLAMAAAAAVTLGLRRRDDTAADWAILSALTLAASPVSWTMGFSLLFLPVAVLLRRTIDAPPFARRGPGGAREVARIGVLAVTAACAGFPGPFWNPDAMVLALVPMDAPLLAAAMLWADGNQRRAPDVADDPVPLT